MNVRALIPLIAGLGIGALALILGINTLKNARAAQRPAAKVKVWVARENIPRGTEIREDMLTTLALPADAVPKGAFKESDKAQLVGRVPQLVAPASLPILESMLAPPGTRPGIFVKPGYRAVAVKIDAGSGVDYHLEPGCFVDVVASFKVRRDGRTETIAKTIVENAELAAVGPRLSPVGAEEGTQARNQNIRAVTLFVRPDQVKTLLLAEQQGRIKLCLRGSHDEQEIDDRQWVSDLELMGVSQQAGADGSKSRESVGSAAGALSWLRGLFARAGTSPEPRLALAAPAPQPWVLHIYRGDRAEVVQFKSRDSSERLDGATAPAASASGPRYPTAPSTPAQPAPAPAEVDPLDNPNLQPGADSEPEELTE